MSPHADFGTRSASWEGSSRTESAYRDQPSKLNDRPASSRGSNPPPRPQLPLRQRQQPLPFILPCPLGPLPPPGGSNFQAVPTAPRESTSRGFTPPETYAWSNHSSPVPGRPEGGAYVAAAAPYPPFPPGPELARHQGPGASNFPPPGGMAPPFSAYSRPGAGPVYDQPPAAALTSSLPASGPSSPYYSPVQQHHAFPPPETQRVLYPKQPAGAGAGVGAGQYPPKELALQYRCDQCQGVFASNGGLKRHKKSHSPKRYHYNGGGATYTNRAVLRVSQVCRVGLCYSRMNRNVD